MTMKLVKIVQTERFEGGTCLLAKNVTEASRLPDPVCLKHTLSPVFELGS